MQQLKDIFQQGSTDIYRWPECATPMIDKINALKPDAVIDLGCGANLYKKWINNLVGVDIATTESA